MKSVRPALVDEILVRVAEADVLVGVCGGYVDAVQTGKRRAAAFAYGVLLGLSEIDNPPIQGGSLLEEVDVISLAAVDRFEPVPAGRVVPLEWLVVEPRLTARNAKMFNGLKTCQNRPASSAFSTVFFAASRPFSQQPFLPRFPNYRAIDHHPIERSLSTQARRPLLPRFVPAWLTLVTGRNVADSSGSQG